jgi:hypothetical protein
VTPTAPAGGVATKLREERRVVDAIGLVQPVGEFGSEARAEEERPLQTAFRTNTLGPYNPPMCRYFFERSSAGVGAARPHRF